MFQKGPLEAKKYLQQFQTATPEENSTVVDFNGDLYDGEIKDGLPDGSGVMLYKVRYCAPHPR